MRKRCMTVLLAVLCMAWSAFGQGAAESASGFREIRIESHPKGWGYAHKSVKADGTITGGHLSGGPEGARVFESSGKVTPDDMKRPTTLAEAFRSRTLPKARPPDQKTVGYKAVAVSFDEKTSITAYATWDGKFQPEEAQSIWELVLKYQVGAW